MKVDFNNLRAQAAYALDNLTKSLNECFLKNEDGALTYETLYMQDSNGKSISMRGNMLIDSDDIQKYMEELRSLILTINAVYEPNDPKFQDNSELIKENGGVERFNYIEK